MVDVVKFMADRFDIFVINLVIADLSLILLVVSKGKLRDDRILILRNGLYVRMQAENGWILLRDFLNHLIDIIRVNVTESDRFDKLILEIGLQNSVLYKVFYQKVHFGSIYVISKFSNIAYLANHISERFEINLIHFQMTFLLLKINIALILIHIEVVFSDLFESLYGIYEICRMELILQIPSVRLEFGKVVYNRVKVGYHKWQLPMLWMH